MALIVIVDDPDCPATGVTVTVRALPLPLKVIAALGTSAVLLEEPVSTSAAAPSASATVKLTLRDVAFRSMTTACVGNPVTVG